MGHTDQVAVKDTGKTGKNVYSVYTCGLEDSMDSMASTAQWEGLMNDSLYLRDILHKFFRFFSFLKKKSSRHFIFFFGGHWSDSSP